MRQKAQKRRNIDLKQTNTLHFLPKKLRFLLQENKVPIKKTTILQYEVPWNNYTFDNQLFSCVEEIDVQKKIDAIKCYSSQEGRDYVKEDFIRGLLRTHGVRIGHQFAEVFEVPRLILKEDALL